GTTLRIHNRYDFRDLSHLRITAEVAVDGEVVERTVLPRLTTPAGRTALLPRPWSVPELGPGQEAFVTLRFVDTTDHPLLGRDHEVGWVQLPLGAGPARPSSVAAEPRTELTVTQTAEEYAIGGDGVAFAVRRSDGALTAWRVGDVDLLASGPEPSLWRAPTDHAGIRFFAGSPYVAHQPYAQWKAA